jgi:hypothetical protein
VPSWTWSDEALHLRHCVFEFWCSGRPPPAGSGLGRQMCPMTPAG